MAIFLYLFYKNSNLGKMVANIVAVFPSQPS